MPSSHPGRSRVVCGLMLALGLILSGCEKKVSDANFRKIAEGQSTQREVEKLLGKGEEDVGPAGMSIGASGLTGTSKESPTQTFVWKEDGAEIVITFKDGKVLQKSAKNLR